MQREQDAPLRIVAPAGWELVRLRLPAQGPAQPEAQTPLAELFRRPARAHDIGLRLVVAQVELGAAMREAQRDLLAAHRARTVAHAAALRRKVGEGVLARGIGAWRHRQAAWQMAE